MADISFQEEQTLAAAAPTTAQPAFFTRLIISTGLAHDEVGASRVLLAVAALVAVIAIGVFFFGSGSNTNGVPKVIPPLPAPGSAPTSGGTAPVGALHFQ